jgi:hypothetical protein
MLEIYNSHCEKIKTLVNELTNTVAHTIQFEANNLASRFYLYALKNFDFAQTKNAIDEVTIMR